MKDQRLFTSKLSRFRIVNHSPLVVMNLPKKTEKSLHYEHQDLPTLLYWISICFFASHSVCESRYVENFVSTKSRRKKVSVRWFRSHIEERMDVQSLVLHYINEHLSKTTLPKTQDNNKCAKPANFSCCLQTIAMCIFSVTLFCNNWKMSCEAGSRETRSFSVSSASFSVTVPFGWAKTNKIMDDSCNNAKWGTPHWILMSSEELDTNAKCGTLHRSTRMMLPSEACWELGTEKRSATRRAVFLRNPIQDMGNPPFRLPHVAETFTTWLCQLALQADTYPQTGRLGCRLSTPSCRSVLGNIGADVSRSARQKRDMKRTKLCDFLEKCRVAGQKCKLVRRYTPFHQCARLRATIGRNIIFTSTTKGIVWDTKLPLSKAEGEKSCPTYSRVWQRRTRGDWPRLRRTF
jgi:hypothetical protein